MQSQKRSAEIHPALKVAGGIFGEMLKYFQMLFTKSWKYFIINNEITRLQHAGNRDRPNVICFHESRVPFVKDGLQP